MVLQRILPPHTYSEWVEVLELLRNKKGDEEVLEAMLQGTLEWQSGVAERFARKLIEVIDYRLGLECKKYQRELNHFYGQEGVLVQALISIRKELIFLSRVVSLPAIPTEERERCYQFVVEQAKSIQSSLEKSAKADRSGKLAYIIRNNRVNTF